MNFEGIEKQGAFSGSMSHVPPPFPILEKTRETPETLCFIQTPLHV